MFTYKRIWFVNFCITLQNLNIKFIYDIWFKYDKSIQFIHILSLVINILIDVIWMDLHLNLSKAISSAWHKQNTVILWGIYYFLCWLGAPLLHTMTSTNECIRNRLWYSMCPVTPQCTTLFLLVCPNSLSFSHSFQHLCSCDSVHLAISTTGNINI